MEQPELPMPIPNSRPFLWGTERRHLDRCLEEGALSGTTSIVRDFEGRFAELLGMPHAVATSNGTTALHLALRVAGVRAGSEVIVPNFSMVAPIFASLYCQATLVPVEAGCDWNLDPERVRMALSPLTAAILAVHTYGLPAHLAALREIAAEAGVPLIEDAAEALGARDASHLAGTAGAFGCFSLYANKTITTGEGGVVVTEDPALAARLRALRNMCFGPDVESQYRHPELGFNYRMSSLQAAFGLGQLEHARDAIEAKITIGELYRTRLSAIPGLRLQPERAGTIHSHWAVPVCIDGSSAVRAEVQRRLASENIETRRCFTPVHRVGWLRGHCRFPEGDDHGLAAILHDQGLCLPTFVGMSEKMVDRVCEALSRAVRVAGLSRPTVRSEAAGKLRIDRPIAWGHHRGGWTDAVEAINRNLHSQRGTLTLSAVEDYFHEASNGAIEEPWVGFVHQVPNQHLGFPDLTRLIALPKWKESEPYCLGLWSLTQYQKDFLVRAGIGVPIDVVRYPSNCDVPGFAPEAYEAGHKRVVLIGEFLRNYQAFYDLDAPGHEKVLLAYPGFSPAKHALVINSSVKAVERLPATAYDELLRSSVVFLNLFDAGANTTVVECLARATPLLVNRVGGVEEYLGQSYPLFYESLAEATALLRDPCRIVEAHLYLSSADRRFLSMDSFINSLRASPVYQALPLA